MKDASQGRLHGLDSDETSDKKYQINIREDEQLWREILVEDGMDKAQQDTAGIDSDDMKFQ